MLLMMPKPWVGGGWVRADQGSQGRKAAQARDSLIQPSYRKDGEGGGSDPPREYNVLRESWGPATPSTPAGPGVQVSGPSHTSETRQTELGVQDTETGPQPLLRMSFLGASSCG